MRRTFVPIFVLALLFLLSPRTFTAAQSCARDADCDGVVDPVDACPNAAGPSSNRGCPVNSQPSGPQNPDDPDGDGIVGGSDYCPNAGGPASNHGCPPSMEPTAGIPDSGVPTATPAPPLPGLLAGDCSAATRDASRVNIRGVPNIEGAIVGTMNPYTLYPVTGQVINALGEQWWHIEGGWVASWVTRAGQNCDGVSAFKIEPGANLDPSDDVTRAIEPDNPPPGKFLALFPFPRYADLADLPVKSVLCDGSVFVGVVGDLNVPPNPCKLLLSNGLGLQITPLGIKLLHDDKLLGTFGHGSDTDPGAPGGAGRDSFVAFPEHPQGADDFRLTIIDRSKLEGGKGKTFIMHDFASQGKAGGGLIVIGDEPMPDGARFGSLVPQSEWDTLGEGGGDDGLHPIDLRDALELQSCVSGDCLTLLVGDPPSLMLPPPEKISESDAANIAERTGHNGVRVYELVDDSDVGAVDLTLPEECARLYVNTTYTKIDTESNCVPVVGDTGNFNYLKETWVQMSRDWSAPGAILKGMFIANWHLTCYSGGLVLDLLLPYDQGSFTIHDNHWGCVIHVTYFETPDQDWF